MTFVPFFKFYSNHNKQDGRPECTQYQQVTMISPALGLITNISDFDSSFLSPVSTKQQDSRPVCTIVTLHTMMMMPPSLGHLENSNGLTSNLLVWQ